jgi:Uncharacterized small protein (DUF2158)
MDIKVNDMVTLACGGGQEMVVRYLPALNDVQHAWCEWMEPSGNKRSSPYPQTELLLAWPE